MTDTPLYSPIGEVPISLEFHYAKCNEKENAWLDRQIKSLIGYGINNLTVIVSDNHDPKSCTLRYHVGGGLAIASGCTEIARYLQFFAPKGSPEEEDYYNLLNPKENLESK
jgi:hypothetical protein